MSGVVTVFVYAVLAIVVVGALVALAVLVLPGTEQLAPATADRTPWALPSERAMTGPDVGRLRLPVTLRGYRFAETDAVLDRLGEEIAYRDAVIETLRAELGGREPLADAGAEVLVDPAELGLADDGDADVEDELVELGETPEETEHEVGPEEPVDVVEDVPDVDLDAPVDVVAVVEPVEVVEEVEVVEVEPEPGPHVVALDDDFPEFDGHDDVPPAGPSRS